MGSRDLVNKFTAGELDPKFIAEVDYDGYRKAARKLRNVLVEPQGGCTRRFGFIYEQVIKNGATFITNIEQVRLIEYEFKNSELYDIIIRPDTVNVIAFDIYLNGVLQDTVGAPAATYTVAMIRQIRWVKDYDRLILLHTDVPPHELRRVAANNWTLTPIQFQFFPTYDYSYSDNPATLPTANTPYWSAGVTFTPNAAAATTVTASIAVFTSNHVGGLIYGNSGVFRITAVNAGGTVATGYVLEDFADTSAIKGELVVLLERAWNDGAAIAGAPVGINRHWPSHGCFYQSRLVMGGSTALPGSVFASVVKAYYDFDDSDSDPSSGWGVEVGVTGNDVLQDVLASKSLVLLSNKGPASTSILIDTPTTPTNAFLNTQGTEGSRNINSVIIDNQILYADRAGNTIWSMAYEIPDTGYNVANASILSTQLIRGPRWADIFDPDDVDGRYYLLVNSDGTLAVYNTISVENIKAWTLALTVGSFVDVACIANQAKAIIRRKVAVALPSGDIDAAYTASGLVLGEPTFVAFRNITTKIVTAVGTPVFVLEGDYLLIGSEIPFTKIGLTFNTPGVLNIDAEYEFLTDTGEWEEFTPLTDTTNGFTQNGNITWTEDQLSNWKSQPIVQTTKLYGDLRVLYWIRIQRTNDAVFVTPEIDTLLIDTENRLYLEKAEFTTEVNGITEPVVMDSQIATTSNAAGLVTGLTHLVGQNVFVYANNFPLETFYVPLSGQIDIKVPNADVVVGIDYTVMVIPMPTLAILYNGLSVYEPSKVICMYIDFNETLGMTIEGQSIPQNSGGEFMSQYAPVPVSGYYKVPAFGGWDPRKEFVISQSYPAPMTLLAISYTLEVSP